MKSKVKVVANMKDESFHLPEMFKTTFNVKFTKETFEALVVMPPSIPACVFVSLATEEGFVPKEDMDTVFENDSPLIFVSEKAQNLVAENIQPDCYEHFWLDMRDNLLEEAENDEFDDDERPDLH